MRFAVARQQGFGEEQAALVDDGYESSDLPDRVKDALRLADRFAGLGRPSEPTTLGDDEVVALLLGMAQVRAASRVLLALGMDDEPDEWRVREVPGRS